MQSPTGKTRSAGVATSVAMCQLYVQSLNIFQSVFVLRFNPRIARFVLNGVMVWNKTVAPQNFKINVIVLIATPLTPTVSRVASSQSL